MSSEIRKFYSDIQFPGYYTIESLGYHLTNIKNPYLQIIDDYLHNNLNVIDVGCGTGLISNLFALRHPKTKFTAIDFSSSINFAKTFAKNKNINNIKYIQEDFIKFNTINQYDIVVCQGVLHHIPKYKTAAEKLMQITKPGGFLIVSLYHPAGKILKKFFNLKYGNNILYNDQEKNPFELSFTTKESLELFKNFNLITSYPPINIITGIKSFINFRSGGLISYVFQKPLK